MSTATDKVVMDDDALRRTLIRIAHEIVEKHADLSDVCLVGIYTRGVAIAQRLRREIAQAAGFEPDVGALDISFYRDDVRSRQPVVHSTRLDFTIDALFDYGRPARIRLAVLADRGHRDLPIRADYVGKNLPTSAEERVFVRL